MRKHLSENESASGASFYRFLRPLIEWERRVAEWGSRSSLRQGIYEFFRFGVKQAWACLFGGLILALLVGTHWFYPSSWALARYDALVIAVVGIQAVLLLTGMETWEEARVIAVFHLVGTVMELFKTAQGSWIYPEESLLRIGEVPLFTGFMYAAVGSYLARVWRLFDFRFTRHPGLPALAILSLCIYANFFGHHYTLDFRWLLFAAAGVLFGRSLVHFRIWKVHRKMPLLLGLLLVALFIWFAENLATYASAWVYPDQKDGWAMVSVAKLGSWFLLMLLSYTMVAAVQGIRRASCPDRS